MVGNPPGRHPDEASDRYLEGLDGHLRCYTLSVDAATRAERRWADVAVGLTAGLPALQSLLDRYEVRFPSEKERYKRGAGRGTVRDINKQGELNESVLRSEALRLLFTVHLSSNACRFLELHVIDPSFPANHPYVYQVGDRYAVALKNNSIIFDSLTSADQEEVRGRATSMD